MQIQLPYGNTFLSIDAEPERVIRSGLHGLKAEDSGEAIVRRAMANPIGGKRLCELAAGKKDAVIIISDHTRPVPSRDILPGMLDELRQGNPDIQITLLVATGCHRAMSEAELRAKVGDEIFKSERIIVHDAFDPESNVDIGLLPSGARLVIDRLAAETQLLISEGFIEPHFFAGFSGGRKSVLPGICDRVTVLGNHCGEFIRSPLARTGILEGNPIHRDMVAAAELAKLRYIVNVVIDENKRTVAAFAGDFNKAHEAGVSFLREYCQVAPIPGDIVVTTNGGAPLDQNLYQCVKGTTAAEASAKENAAIILCAEMADGVGAEGFYKDMRGTESPSELYARFASTPQTKTAPDQWQTQILCRILSKHRVIMVTRPEMREAVLNMKMEYAPDLNTALAMAGEGELTVIPDGVSVCICKVRDA